MKHKPLSTPERNLEEKLDHLKETVGKNIDPQLVAKLVREDRSTH